MTGLFPGYDQVVLAAPEAARLCNSLACARTGRPAVVIATYGVLNDPGESLYARGALWRECWGRSYPLQQARQVAVTYRPGLVVIGTADAPTGGQPAGVATAGGRA